MDHATAIQYKPFEPMSSPMYSQVNYANIDATKWYFLSLNVADYIANVFLVNEHGTSFMITHMLDREEPVAEWVDVGVAMTLTAADIDGDQIKVYIYEPVN